MITEIKAKTLLSRVKGEDTWFGLTYNMNLYRGCEHQCIYCDSRSECYGIENFSDVLVKVNAIEVLRKELAGKRIKGTIGTGSMSDPYTRNVEKRYNLTGQALQAIADFHFPVHIITKSDMVLKDLETLIAINNTLAVVSFTITTADDDLARKLEPGAPSPSARFQAMKILAEHGIHTGITMMPILPFIEDTPENIENIIRMGKAHGAAYILPWFGMSMRDRQRDYFYHKLDKLFPDVKEKYIHRYGNNYSCPTPNAKLLNQLFDTLCNNLHIATRVPHYQPESEAKQLALF